jgi:uncharacterized protein YdiU (UPF0061 family)
MNQPMAAVVNFRMFCTAMVPLLGQDARAIEALDEVVQALPDSMADTLHAMWAQKMGLIEFRAELFAELHTLMAQTPVDYTIFWRELSSLPEQVADLRPSFYASRGAYGQDPAVMEARWGAWLQKWHTALAQDGRDPLEVSMAMKQVNPKYIPREWMLGRPTAAPRTLGTSRWCGACTPCWLTPTVNSRQSSPRCITPRSSMSTLT